MILTLNELRQLTESNSLLHRKEKVLSSATTSEAAMVTTTQKRKRSSLDSAIEDENEENIQSSVKSSKRESTAESALTDEIQAIVATAIETSSVSIDSRESCSIAPAPKPFEVESGTSNELDHNLSKSITSVAHKQILQQQWTTEAHGHLFKIQPVEWADESIGTEILSENNFPDRQHHVSPPKGVGVSSKALKRTPNAVTVTAPLPRAIPQKAESSSDNVELLHPTVVNEDPAVNVSLSGSSDIIADFSSGTSSSSSVSDRTESNSLQPGGDADKSATLGIKTKSSSPKKTSYVRINAYHLFAIFFGFLAVLLFSCFHLGYRIDKGISNEAPPGPIEETVIEVLKPELDFEMLSHTSNLVKHLSALEDEALLLIDILDGTAAVEAEAELLQSRLDTEKLDYHSKIESDLNSFDHLVTLLEKETIVSEESVLKSRTDISDNLRLLNIDKEAEVPKIFPIAVLLEEEKRVEIAINQIDEEIEIAAAAPAVPAAEAVSYTEAAENLVEEISDPKDGENILPDPLDDEVNAAMVSAEETLSSLESQTIKSVSDIDSAVREHLSILVEETVNLAAKSAAALAEESSLAAALAAELLAEMEKAKELQEIINAETKKVLDNISISAGNIHKGLAHLQYLDLDYAVWPRGGRVIPPGETANLFGKSVVLTSPPYVLSLGPLKRLRYQLHLNREAADESVLISHSSGERERGQKGQYSCYAFAGSSGSVTVTMHSPVRVSAVQIMHRPRPSGKREQTSAPKQIQLIGWTEVPSSTSKIEGIDLGIFSYEISEDKEETDGLQTLHLSNADSTEQVGGYKQTGILIPPLKAVTIFILSNHGNPGYSSICRIKVLGQLETGGL